MTMRVLTCGCGVTTLSGVDAVADCIGCPTCFTTLREQAPFPMVEPHQPGPIDRDDPESPIICRTCGATVGG